VDAGVICAPVLPGITDAPKQLEAVVRAAARAKASHIYANPLFLKSCAAKMFLPFVEEHFPELLASYRARYKDNAYVSPTYRKRIAELMNKFARKYGLPDGEERVRRREANRQQSQPSGEQLKLF